MVRPSLYLETSVVSYLTARPSRDLVTAARQRITLEWWETRSSEYDIFNSPLVLDEARDGDPQAAAERLAVLQGLDSASGKPETERLADALMLEVPIPSKVAADATHIAIATSNGAEYLLTWNFKHLANATLRESISAACRRLGFEPPVICTPEDLLEGVTR